MQRTRTALVPARARLKRCCQYHYPICAPEPCSEAGHRVSKVDAHVCTSLVLDVLLHVVEKAPCLSREGAIAAHREDDMLST